MGRGEFWGAQILNSCGERSARVGKGRRMRKNKNKKKKKRKKMKRKVYALLGAEPGVSEPQAGESKAGPWKRGAQSLLGAPWRHT